MQCLARATSWRTGCSLFVCFSGRRLLMRQWRRQIPLVHWCGRRSLRFHLRRQPLRPARLFDVLVFRGTRLPEMLVAKIYANRGSNIYSATLQAAFLGPRCHSPKNAAALASMGKYAKEGKGVIVYACLRC